MRAITRYPGSKWRIAKWIIDFFPDHHSYLEPFLGSGAVLLNKSRSNIETVNDLDGSVVNLFEWIKKDPERLARAIYYTPYARQAYEEAFLSMPRDSFGRAVNFYTRLNMGFGFRTTGEKVGWKNDIQGRERAYAAQDWCKLPEKIMQVTERLRGVQIECKPAVDVIRRFNHQKVLIYCDPPYMLETRCKKQYRHELEDSDHVELLGALLDHEGSVLISGYESDLYNEILAGWHKEYKVSRTQGNVEKKEVLWMNYDPVKE